jgi:ferredoxin
MPPHMESSMGKKSGADTINPLQIIDRSTCVSCGSFWDTGPGFFEQNPDNSFSQVIEKFRLKGDIAQGNPLPELNDCARDASELCPVQIIRIEES